MNSYINLPAERQRILCEQASAHINLAPASIEKDFWVCWILRELFNLPDWEEHLTFKGGTSLSKGWGLISRFSEDIDIVIERVFLGFDKDILNKSQIKKLRDACSHKVQEELLPAFTERLQTVLPDEITWKLYPADKTDDADQLTLLFQYPSVFAETSIYLQPIVKIELGGRADTEPVELPIIEPYITQAFPDFFPDNTFTVRTVAPRRTFWEKAMLLHEEKLRPAAKQRKARLSRHYYDLWCLIKKDIAQQAMEDLGLFERVVEHRKVFFEQRWVDYKTLCKGSLDLMPSEAQLPQWRQDYADMREVMFFDEPPTFDEILQHIQSFQDEFNRN